MSYRVAVFDMDGTILNTLEDIAGAVNYALTENGLPTRTIEEVRNFVGNGLKLLVDRAVPEGSSEETAKKVFDTMIPYYIEHSSDKTAPYDGICELLSRLKAAGIICAVVSNKADAAVQELAVKYFDGLFVYALGEQNGIAKKPAPDMTMKVLEKIGARPEEAVYIGDSDVDVMTAKNSGLDEIIVDWGFRDRDFLKAVGATRIVSTTEEVYRIITE